MTKKILSLLLCFLLSFALLAHGVSATPVENGDRTTVYGFRLSGTDSDSGQAFIQFFADEPANVTVVAQQDEPPAIYAGTYASGLFYGIDRKGDLFSSPLNEFARTYIGTALPDAENTCRAVELTYDYANGRLLMLAHDIQTDVRTGTLYAVDMQTAGITELCRIGNNLAIHALADDPDGKVYAIDSLGDLYTIDITSGVPTKIGSTGYAVSLLQSMCFDRQSGKLYWARYSLGSSVLCEVNTSTGELTELGVIGDHAQISGLCIAGDSFRVQFEVEAGGSAGANGGNYYKEGDRVSITATPDKGYTFGGWSVSAGVLSSVTEESCTLVMPTPGQDVTVKAFFIPSNRYTQRTVRDNEAGVSVSGNIYYNATVRAEDLTEGDAYARLQAKIKNKAVIDAMTLHLETHASQGVMIPHKGNVTVSIRVDSAYEGKKLAVWQATDSKIVKTVATVRDGVLTYKTAAVTPVMITEGGGFSFGSFLLILLILLLLAVGVVYLLHLRHMARLRAKRSGKPIRKKSLRTRIGHWLRSRKKK